MRRFAERQPCDHEDGRRLELDTMRHATNSSLTLLDRCVHSPHR